MSAELTYLDYLITLATDRINKFDRNEALYLMRRAVEKFPGYAKAYHKLADLLIEAGDYTEAQKILEQGLGVHPDFGPFWLTRVKLILIHDKKQDLPFLYCALKNPEFSVDIAFEVYRLFNSAQWFAENLSFFKAVEFGQKGGAWLPYAQSETHLSLGQVKEATLTLAKADANFDPVWHRLLRSRQLLQQQDFVNAGSELEAALQSPQLNLKSVINSLPVFDALGEGQAGTKILLSRLGEKSDDVTRAVLNQRLGRRPTYDPKQVVFVVDRIRGRHLKISSALRKQGWRTVFLYTEGEHAEVAPFTDEAIRFFNSESALWIAKCYNPCAYHLSVGFGDATTFLITRERIGKTVFDPYDVIEGLMFVPQYADLSSYQSYCISNADGLCARDLRARYLFRNLGIPRPKNICFFTEYCWDEEDIARTQTKLAGIHAALCGFITMEGEENEHKWGFLRFAQSMAEQNIFTHFYPQPMQFGTKGFDPKLAPLIELSQKNEFVHVHRPVTFAKLPSELGQYHVGININFSDMFGQPNPLYSTLSNRMCASARAIEYLDSGLLSLIGPELKFGAWFLRRKGGAVVANLQILQDLRSTLGPIIEDAKLQSQLLAVRRELAISNQVKRLIKFYESL